MSETKFTQGPWRPGAVPGGWDGVWTEDRTTLICNLVENNPDNAHLIAAAPALAEALEALTIATERWNEAVESVIGRQPWPEGSRDAVAMARAALARARGEETA